MQRKLLSARGYRVEVALDGVDGWNSVRAGAYDLVITDIDMPRMDGIGLLGLIRQDPRLQRLPVMIVSYKDRPEDRARGLEAGADWYLAKGAFHDASLLDAVRDLIGDALPGAQP
jgi:two-component system sensor histidine kinase and response regulator WspE